MRHSEKLVIRWLEDLGVTYQFEAERGRKRPDFSVVVADGDLREAIEVKDLCWGPQHRKHEEEGVRADKDGRLPPIYSHDPYTPIRDSIGEARKQFRAVEGFSCMVVLYADGPHRLSDLDIFCAMLGDLTIHEPIVGRSSDTTPRLGFGKGGKMIGAGRVPQNTRVSGVAVVQEMRFEAYRSGMMQSMDAEMTSLTRGRDVSFCDLVAAGAAIEQEYRERGVNVDLTMPCLTICLNPFAEYPWPRELVGPFDRLLEFDVRTGELRLALDGLSPRRPDEE